MTHLEQSHENLLNLAQGFVSAWARQIDRDEEINGGDAVEFLQGHLADCRKAIALAEPETKVIFRSWPKEGDVIALFPALAGDSDPSTCLSYQTIGQHGAASVALMRTTKPATEKQIWKLLNELERIGYRVHPVKKFTRADYLERCKQINR